MPVVALSTYHPRLMTPGKAFKGNKSYLASKPCQACGRPMTWRKRWAAQWQTIKFCSTACRRKRGVREGG